MSPAFLRELRQVGKTVRITSLGLAGDIGRRTPLLMLMTEDGGLEELLLSTIGVAAARRVTITSSPLFRSSHCAYDNDDPLPPFPDRGRNGDGVFGAALSRIFGGGSILHLPSAVEHYSKHEKPLDIGALSDSLYRINDVLLLLIVQWRSESLRSYPRCRQSHLANYLLDLGQGTPASFRSFVTEILARQLSMTVYNLERLRKLRGHLHEQWQEDITRVIETAENRLRDDEFLDARLSWNDVQKHVESYGYLLLIWPSLWQRAQETPFSERGLLA